MAWMVHDYPEPGSPEHPPLCPVCGAECATAYRNWAFEIVGCDECVMACDAWETAECLG